MPRAKSVSVKYVNSRRRWLVRYIDDRGKDKKAYFKDEQEAKQMRRQLLDEIRDFGWRQDALNAEEQRQAVQALEELKPYGVGLLAAARYYVQRHRQAQVTGEQAETEFLEAWAKRDLRGDSLPAYARHLKRWRSAFGRMTIDEPSRQDILDWMLGTGLAPKTLRSLRTHLSVFYNFCVERKYREDNPVKTIGKDLPRLDAGARAHGFFSFKEVYDMLAAADSTVAAQLALQLFAGIRPREMERLTAKEVDFELRQIWIPGEVSKIRRPRVLKNLPENLWTWLDPLKELPEDEPLIRHWRFRKRILAVREKAGITRWPHDVLRHTFATYATDAAALGMEGFALAWIRNTMGHQTESMLSEYEGVLRRHEDTRQFWELTPDSLSAKYSS
ncbi:MAG: tyrosine-type recombinase/integrase [Verrucomicrobiota bacterium]